MNPGGPDDILIIVIAAVGGSVVIVGLCVCTILVWCCLIKNNSKWNHFRRTQRNNYKGNTSYVLPYTIYGEQLVESPHCFVNICHVFFSHQPTDPVLQSSLLQTTGIPTILVSFYIEGKYATPV